MGWFRTVVQIPERVGGFPVAGSPAHLLANIDDYGEIGVDGPIREHYLVTESDTDDESRLVTEVCWPVFQTTPSSRPTAPQA